MRKSLIAAASALTLATGTIAAMGAPAALATPKPAAHHFQVILDWHPAHAAVITSPEATLSTIPLFKHCFTDPVAKKSYCDTLVGKSPYAKGGGAATVKIDLIPIVVSFGGYTWNPTTVNSCDTQSALKRTQYSPIFKVQTWKFGGTSVGSHTYESAFMRAEFWNQAKPTGTNPKYGVNFSVATHAAWHLTVPSADSAVLGTAVCGNGKLGGININWFDPVAQQYISSTLGAGASTTFPFFVVENVVWYVGTKSQCCVIGYHNAMTNAGRFQTYGVADYDASGDFANLGDVAAMTHEVGEWLNDPGTNNATAPWGNIGQVSGCQSNFEVGDPLSGTEFTDTLNGFTYHLQELAFAGWFYHLKPSGSIHGWYSDEGTFKTYAAPCT